jgi:hypothetical protein
MKEPAMFRRGGKKPKWAMMPLTVRIEPATSSDQHPLDIKGELTSLRNSLQHAAATWIDQRPMEREALMKDIKDKLASLETRIRDDPATCIDVYSVEPEAPLRRKLDSGATIAIVGPTSHVTGRRARRFSTAPDLVVLVGDPPTAADPLVSQQRRNAGVALRLALRAMPQYARQEFEQETIAALEDGCVDRAGNRIVRTVWLIRNLIDLVCSGLRLRLGTRPLYCLPIWRTPHPDPDLLQNLRENLRGLLK